MHVTHQCGVFSRHEISRTDNVICVSWRVTTRSSATAMATSANSLKERFIHTRLVPLIPVSPTPEISSYSIVLPPWNYAIAHHLAPRHSVHFRSGGIVLESLDGIDIVVACAHNTFTCVAQHDTATALHAEMLQRSGLWNADGAGLRGQILACISRAVS